MAEMTILTMSGFGVTGLPDEVLTLPKSDFYRWMQQNATPIRCLNPKERDRLRIVRKRALQRRYAHESRQRKRERDEHTVIQLKEVISELRATILALRIELDESKRHIEMLEKDYALD